MELRPTGDAEFDKAFEGISELVANADEKSRTKVSKRSNPFGLTGEDLGEADPGQPAENRLTGSIMAKAAKMRVFGQNLAGLAGGLVGGVVHSLWDHKTEIAAGGAAAFAVKTAIRTALVGSGGIVAAAAIGAAGGLVAGVVKESIRQRGSIDIGEAEKALIIGGLKNEFRRLQLADKQKIAVAGAKGAVFGAIGGVIGAEIAEWLADNEIAQAALSSVREKISEILPKAPFKPRVPVSSSSPNFPAFRPPLSATETPTLSPTATPTPESTFTPTSSPTASPTSTMTPTRTPFPTETPSPTAISSATPTASATVTSTWTPTPESSPTSTATVTPTRPPLTVETSSSAKPPDLAGITDSTKPSSADIVSGTQPAGTESVVSTETTMPAETVEQTAPDVPKPIDHIIAPNGAEVSGSALDNTLTYNGKSWNLLTNGEKNIGNLFKAVGETGSINHDVLGAKLQEAATLWANGQLNPAAQPDLYKVFHLSNGTASLYQSLLDDEDTLESLIKLGIVRK